MVILTDSGWVFTLTVLWTDSRCGLKTLPKPCQYMYLSKQQSKAWHLIRTLAKWIPSVDIYHGQWWSIRRIHLRQILQWWARGGRYASHFIHTLQPSFCKQSNKQMFWNFPLIFWILRQIYWTKNWNVLWHIFQTKHFLSENPTDQTFFANSEFVFDNASCSCIFVQVEELSKILIYIFCIWSKVPSKLSNRHSWSRRDVTA